MSQFAYTVSEPGSGMRTSGVLIASDREAALRTLNDKNLIVTRLSPIRETSVGLLERLGYHKYHLHEEQLLSLTQQMGAMLAAGMTVKSCLDVLLEDTTEPGPRTLLLEMSAGLAAGCSFTEVLSRYPAVFDKQYATLVATGESSGKLPEMMQRLATLIENSLTLKKKVQTAFYYPTFVLSFAFMMLVLLFLFGIPRFEEIYRGFGGKLPVPTQILIAIGHFCGLHWMVLLGGLTLTLLVAARLSETDKGRWFCDTVKLNAPIIGPLTRKLVIARFARTLATLHASGVPIVQSLDLVASSMGNVIMEKVVRDGMRNVMQGESITDTLRRSGYFTQMAVSMMAAGEHSGTLDNMLERVGDFYETQVDITLRGLASLLEPIIMVVVGVMVGGIIVAMILPIFRLAALLFTH